MESWNTANDTCIHIMDTCILAVFHDSMMNECTKEQNPRYRDVTLNASVHLSMNKNSAEIIKIIHVWAFFSHQLAIGFVLNL